jgi:hypothetical protein
MSLIEKQSQQRLFSITALGQLLEQRRRLVESEHKRLIAMEQMITAEQAMLLVTRLVGIVNDRISDNGIRAAIAADLRALVTANPGR